MLMLTASFSDGLCMAVANGVAGWQIFRIGTVRYAEGL